ncbi:MAG: nucleotide exchange factor GrpE [Clostridiales bacterium]|nr:nucleotide exchange factor GrpE [Clostridiales bacterium]
MSADKEIKHNEEDELKETLDDNTQDSQISEGVEESQPSELEKAQALAEDYKRKWYLVSAEYDNFRRRNQAAVAQAFADGKAEAVLKLLPVSDTFGYAYDGASDEKTKSGIDKIIKNFNNILASLGIEEISVNIGDDFDENIAEAIMNMPCAEGEKPNQIKQILKKGYKSGEKVIRFAQVIVTV